MTSGLFKPVYAAHATAFAYLLNQQQKKKVNECHVDAHAMQDAEALQAIMQEGGGMMDVHEMMELMAEQRTNLKPFNFEKLMQNTAMFKQHEVIDGLSLNFNFPLSNSFQLGAQWSLSNSKGANFEINTCLNNFSGSPLQKQDEVQQAQLRFSTDNTGMVVGMFNLPFKTQLQTQTMFNDDKCKEVINMCTLSRDFSDSSIQGRIQTMGADPVQVGVYTLTYMQSLSKYLQTGFQMIYQVSIPQI